MDKWLALERHFMEGGFSKDGSSVATTTRIGNKVHSCGRVGALVAIFDGRLTSA